MVSAPRCPFILSLILLLLASGAVMPVASMDLVDGTLGHSVHLVIPVDLPSQYRIDWNCGHAGKVIVIARLTYGGSPQYNPVYGGRSEMLENGTLRLNDISYEDEGTYKVKVFNPETFTSYIHRYQLKVYATLTAPVLHSIDAGLIISGTHMTLHCDAGSQTVTAYTFYRDQKMICSEPHVTCSGSSLDLTPISEDDSGSYTCRIENPVSSYTSDPITVTVSVPVSSVTLTSNTSGLVWPGRDSVSLHCSARGTDITYSWSLEDGPLPENPRYHFSQNNSTLIIDPVSSDDSRPITCRAANWMNEETSSKVNFQFASPVSAVTMSSNASSAELWAGQDSVSLHCSAQGSAITFSWSLDGKPVSSQPPYYITGSDSPPYSSLTISPVSRNDGGPFTCTASNLLNSQTSNELSFTLAWSPEGSMECLATSSTDEDMVLGCSWPGGIPPANVTMRFNHTLTTALSNVTRNVSGGSDLQGSELACLGDQMGRTSSCSVTLEPPRFPEHDNSAVINMEEGRTATMRVTLRPGLPAQFTWLYFNPDPVPVRAHKKFTVESNNSASSLLVSEVTEREAGKYQCRAVNVIGTETFNFNLKVTKQAPHGLSTGAIVGIVIGVLAALIMLALLIFILIRRKASKDKSYKTRSR